MVSTYPNKTPARQTVYSSSLEDLTPLMTVVKKVFVPLHCHIALIGSFGRHIEESAFRLFLLRKLDTYKSNIGVRRKTLFLVRIRFNTKYSQAELPILLICITRSPTLRSG